MTDKSIYFKYYKSNDLYWGIGIENETYLQKKNDISLPGSYIKSNRKRERYSIDYGINLKQSNLEKYLDLMFTSNDIFSIPQYVNSHSLSKTDINGEHKNMYSYSNILNKNFTGFTIEDIMKYDYVKLENDYGKNYLYDGDSIEFVTQDFYNQTVKNCVSELKSYKKFFLNKLNSVLHQNNLFKVIYPRVNYGMVQYDTNKNNVNFFNNGTYHINLTMPTKLDAECNILDVKLFNDTHSNAIRLIQWLEPLIVALYGSPDFLSVNSNQAYASGSLRLSMSRYIGIGTYDTLTMITGKLLNTEKISMAVHHDPTSWYNNIYGMTNYLPGTKIGYDFNFKKHFNSGIEFRIFDYFPEDALTDLINFLILVMDHSLTLKIKIFASNSNIWNSMVTSALINGYVGEIDPAYAKILHDDLGLPLIIETDIPSYMSKLVNYLYSTYRNNLCSKLMSPSMPKPTMHNINKYMWEKNYCQYVPMSNPKHIKVVQLYELYKNKNADMTDLDSVRILNLLLVLNITNPDLDIKDIHMLIRKYAKEKTSINRYKL